MISNAQVVSLIKALDSGESTAEDRLQLLKELNEQIEGMRQDIVELKQKNTQTNQK